MVQILKSLQLLPLFKKLEQIDSKLNRFSKFDKNSNITQIVLEYKV